MVILLSALMNANAGESWFHVKAISVREDLVDIANSVSSMIDLLRSHCGTFKLRPNYIPQM